jgi:O-acetyl-ADP-ribose deacetylase (regulator of RNase III)
MNQSERRLFLIERLLAEEPRYRKMKIPSDAAEQKRLLRSLLNLRPPGEIAADFLDVQDAYLREETQRKGVTALSELSPVLPELYLWQGDITTLAADAIVNAANSGMTGCYQPCHSCIDNCIHTYAGVQLRNRCAEIMAEQGCEEPVGLAKITPGYNLPCRYVIHTVGPVVQDRLTKRHEEELASCYRSCLEAAAANGCGSVAFCCVSTGLFGFPPERAAEIAVETVKRYKAETNSRMEVIFNVFRDNDYQIYRNLLGEHGKAEAGA